MKIKKFAIFISVLLMSLFITVVFSVDKKQASVIKTVEYSVDFLINSIDKLNEEFFNGKYEEIVESIVHYGLNPLDSTIEFAVIDLDKEKEQLIIEIVTEIVGASGVDFVSFENVPSDGYIPTAEQNSKKS